jgi:hypothetical protein
VKQDIWNDLEALKEVLEKVETGEVNEEPQATSE